MRNILLISWVVAATLSPGLSIAQNTKATGLYQIGKKDYDDSKYPQAIEVLKEAVKASPEYEDALYYLAGSYYHSSNYDDAIDILQKLEKVNPDYWPYSYYWWGNCYFYKNDLDNMKSKFEVFLKKTPNTPKFQMDIHKALVVRNPQIPSEFLCRSIVRYQYLPTTRLH